MNTVNVGDEVRIKRGACGEGYRFKVAEITSGGYEPIVYGHNYGPVRLSEVEKMPAYAASEAP